VFIVNTSTQSAGIGALFLGKVGGLFNVIVGGAMQLFFEDRIGITGLELALEIAQG
jgi:hypothetical protein